MTTAASTESSKTPLTKQFFVSLLLTLLAYQAKAQTTGNFADTSYFDIVFWALLLITFFLFSLVLLMWKPKKEAPAPAKKDLVGEMLEKMKEEDLQKLRQAGGKFVKNSQGEVEAFVSVLRFGKDKDDKAVK